ncbi:MAG: hypothetical protein ACPL1Z_03875 [Candidatus Bathyarchaeales archaeon]
MKSKTAITALIILLTVMIFSQTIPLHVNAVGVAITSISPETHEGKVGELIRLAGTINTTDGEYKIWFENNLITTNTSIGNSVNYSFLVPQLPNGNYTITLMDVAANVNATTWFYIETDYILEITRPPHPQQLQEGAAVNISVSITGGKENTVYAANVTVKTPANETYWALVHLSNTGYTGTGNATITYPNDFGINAHTNYTGTYIVNFNGTLTSATFFIGLTDRAEYHRGDLMKIKAVGYSMLNNDNVTITITFGNTTIARLNKTVIDGVVDANWTVPSNVIVGNYTLSIKPTPSSKKVNDAQVFAVPGFKTEIFTFNLADGPASGVLVRIYDMSVNTTYNVTSSGDGIASTWLEKGSYNSTAFFKRVRVSGPLEFEVIDESITLNLSCQLTSLNIAVASAQNPSIKIPFVSLNLTYNYTTELDGVENKTETVFLQTDIMGKVQLHSLLLNAVYRVNASRYGKIFNQNNSTFSNLQPLPWNNIVILCPEKPLHVNVVDAEGQPIANAMVEAQEFMGGLHFISYTDQSGNATLNCIIGKYRVKVYSNSILLKETTVELFDENTTTIHCTLYNLPIYIKVVDYFGQPIPNANVTLERNGIKISSKLTGNNGIADFTEIGGNLTVKVYLGNQDQPALTFTCSVVKARGETNPIKATLGNYVILAGFLMETAHFSMIVLAIAAIALFTIIEFGVRKRLKK